MRTCRRRAGHVCDASCYGGLRWFSQVGCPVGGVEPSSAGGVARASAKKRGVLAHMHNMHMHMLHMHMHMHMLHMHVPIHMHMKHETQDMRRGREHEHTT